MSIQFQDPLLGSIPNLLGIFFTIATGSLLFFWGKRANGVHREAQVTRTQNLIWSSVLNATDALDPETLEPFEVAELTREDLEQRRFVSSVAEDEIRDYLNEIVKPMTDHDRISELDETIEIWLFRAGVSSLATSVWTVALVVITFFWPKYPSLKVLISVPFLAAIVVCASKVFWSEWQFDRIYDHYKQYRK